MLPQVYQTCFQSQLSATQFLTLEILVWLLQAHKQVRIERLADKCPAHIKDAIKGDWKTANRSSGASSAANANGSIDTAEASLFRLILSNQK